MSKDKKIKPIFPVAGIGGAPFDMPEVPNSKHPKPIQDFASVLRQKEETIDGLTADEIGWKLLPDGSIVLDLNPSCAGGYDSRGPDEYAGNQDDYNL